MQDELLLPPEEEEDWKNWQKMWEEESDNIKKTLAQVSAEMQEETPENSSMGNPPSNSVSEGDIEVILSEDDKDKGSGNESQISGDVGNFSPNLDLGRLLMTKNSDPELRTTIKKVSHEIPGYLATLSQANRQKIVKKLLLLAKHKKNIAHAIIPKTYLKELLDCASQSENKYDYLSVIIRLLNLGTRWEEAAELLFEAPPQKDAPFHLAYYLLLPEQKFLELLKSNKVKGNIHTRPISRLLNVINNYLITEFLKKEYLPGICQQMLDQQLITLEELETEFEKDKIKCQGVKSVIITHLKDPATANTAYLSGSGNSFFKWRKTWEEEWGEKFQDIQKVLENASAKIDRSTPATPIITNLSSDSNSKRDIEEILSEDDEDKSSGNESQISGGMCDPSLSLADLLAPFLMLKVNLDEEVIEKVENVSNEIPEYLNILSPVNRQTIVMKFLLTRKSTIINAIPINFFEELLQETKLKNKGDYLSVITRILNTYVRRKDEAISKILFH